MGTIVSIERMKDYLGLTQEDSLDDARVQSILAGVEARVENFLADTKLIIEAGLTQKFDNGSISWILDNRPVVSIESITDEDSNTIEASFYELIGEHGFIRHRRFPPVGVNAAGQSVRWTVSYTAGQFADENNVPDDIQLAIMMLCAERFQRPEPGIQAIRSLTSSTAYIPNPTNSIMPPDVLAVLSPYVRRGV